MEATRRYGRPRASSPPRWGASRDARRRSGERAEIDVPTALKSPAPITPRRARRANADCASASSSRRSKYRLPARPRFAAPRVRASEGGEGASRRAWRRRAPRQARRRRGSPSRSSKSVVRGGRADRLERRAMEARGEARSAHRAWQAQADYQPPPSIASPTRARIATPPGRSPPRRRRRRGEGGDGDHQRARDGARRGEIGGRGDRDDENRTTRARTRRRRPTEQAARGSDGQGPVKRAEETTEEARVAALEANRAGEARPERRAAETRARPRRRARRRSAFDERAASRRRAVSREGGVG